MIRPAISMIFIFLLSFSSISSEGYVFPSDLSQEIWDAARPYFLPETHPLKARLDQIFSDSRVIYSEESMRKAGFVKPTPRKYTCLVVTRHPDLPGMIIKTYLDYQRYFDGLREDEQWLQRIEGARLIQELVNSKGWQDHFKVPKKWIYPLPEWRKPSTKFQWKYFILVEEDMDLCDAETNKAVWGSSSVTSELLDKVYYIVTELGLYDTPSGDNLPFSYDGRLAFIDTQFFYIWPVGYKKLYPVLSNEMLLYWKARTKGRKT